MHSIKNRSLRMKCITKIKKNTL